MEIIRGKQNRPQRVVLYGPEGIGKSTFGSKFPKPLFIDTEGSTGQLDVSRTATPTSWQYLKQIVEHLKVDQMGFETLVVDTIDWAETLCCQDVCANHNKKGIEDFGYGKGFTFLCEEWGRFMNLLTDVRDNGMHVVLLAHAHMRKFEQPDESGAYDRWELKLSKKCSPLTKEWADMVLFANYKTVVVDVDGKKKAQGGKRVMYTTHHPCWDAKNRHDLAEELPLEFSSIGHLIGEPDLPTPTMTVSPSTSSSPSSGPTPDAIVDDIQYSHPDPNPEPTGTAVPETDPAAFPAKLWALMEENQVTEAEIRKVVATKGKVVYYTEDIPIASYDQAFVDGVLVALWDSVVYPKVLEVRQEQQQEKVA